MRSLAAVLAAVVSAVLAAVRVLVVTGLVAALPCAGCGRETGGGGPAATSPPPEGPTAARPPVAGARDAAAGAAAPAAAPPITPAQAAAVLARLNELCPESWCEGDYELRFTALDCPERTACRLSFTATPYGSSARHEATVPVHGFLSVLDDGRPSDTFLHAVTKVLDAWRPAPGAGADASSAASP